MKNFDAILLTAGKSTRMGRDKALLEINNRKIINIIIEKLINSINNNVHLSKNFCIFDGYSDFDIFVC